MNASIYPESPLHPGGRNLLLRLSYDGTDYSGWQIQPLRRTIQGVLTGVFSNVLEESVQLHGAGRTDAGVHACAQAASLVIQSPIPCPNLQRVLNHHLPESIRVLSVQEVPREFHARHNAKSKTYRYRIYRPALCPPWLSRYLYPFSYPLNVEKMQRAARDLEGTHDFRSFASSDEGARDPRRSTTRTIFSSCLERAGPIEPEAGLEAEQLIYTVTGSGFLNHMVRNIVGTLLSVGRGTLGVDAIPSILAARNRSAAGPTAPARGLHLVRVHYPELESPGEDKSRPEQNGVK